MNPFRTPRAEIEHLQQRLDDLEKRHNALLTAFNDFFDVIAEELGFEAKTITYYNRYTPDAWTTKDSPRRLARTEPKAPPSTLVRKPRKVEGS